MKNKEIKDIEVQDAQLVIEKTETQQSLTMKKKERGVTQKLLKAWTKQAEKILQENLVDKSDEESFDRLVKMVVKNWFYREFGK